MFISVICRQRRDIRSLGIPDEAVCLATNHRQADPEVRQHCARLVALG
ncbi:MAG: hypothetical protein AVDCRST_MAG93-8260 [uncultured Chloroflexia bacterium]|uniref:Uncharacterized protein n=1 Tax=uncultured Chloroflexia bacterium TaxID=1672391 RepID=A0A6J4MUJ0_9CHLR|nr:MAG: hypothetical protein AVDCRST_MAG93-8260 [uncultured Chloroflexia bacterium]